MRRLVIIIVLFIPLCLKAAGDSTIVKAIRKYNAALYFPRLVERFYQQNGYQLAWIAPDTVKTHAWDAMMLLDCVRQYGLVHDDYHPRELLYDKLHQLIEKTGTEEEKARFDILLTDALIRFMNNLHYGKLNPKYTAEKIDRGTAFKADRQLLSALLDKNFSGAVISVQPKEQMYFDLQYHMHLLVGLRIGDCYVVPKGLERKMAVNLERLRWISTTGKRVHLTCIVRKGIVIYYKDTGNSDQILEDALYNKMPAKKRSLGLEEIKPIKPL